MTMTMGEKFMILQEIVEELADASDFMSTFEGYEDEEAIERREDKHKAISKGETLLQQIEEEYKEVLEDGDHFDGSYRICDECNRIMIEGFSIDGGDKTYCSETCLHRHLSEEEFLEVYDDGEGDSYWTSWHEG